MAMERWPVCRCEHPGRSKWIKNYCALCGRAIGLPVPEKKGRRGKNEGARELQRDGEMPTL
jgi:hypothetical protein